MERAVGRDDGEPELGTPAVADADPSARGRRRATLSPAPLLLGDRSGAGYGRQGRVARMAGGHPGIHDVAQEVLGNLDELVLRGADAGEDASAPAVEGGHRHEVRAGQLPRRSDRPLELRLRGRRPVNVGRRLSDPGEDDEGILDDRSGGRLPVVFRHRPEASRRAARSQTAPGRAESRGCGSTVGKPASG